MCVECDLAQPESLASLVGSAPGVVDGILSIIATKRVIRITNCGCCPRWKRVHGDHSPVVSFLMLFLQQGVHSHLLLHKDGTSCP